MTETNNENLEKKLGIFTGKYWLPLVGPFLMMNDMFDKSKSMIGASEQIGNGAIAFMVAGTYLTYQTAAYAGTAAAILYGLSKILS